MQMPDFLQHILAIFHRIDPLELGLERFYPRRVHGFFVHAARVEISHLLHVRRSRLFHL